MSDRPVVTVVVNAMNPGGAERMVLDIAAGLPVDRWECHLISLGGADDPLLGPARAVFESVTVARPRARWDPRTAADLTARFKDAYGDRTRGFVHAHLPRAGVHARLAARRAGVPCIYTEHNIPACYHPLTRALNWATIGSCSRVVAVSKAVAETTPGRRGDREVTVIPNGVAVPPLPSDEDRRAARESLGVGDDELVVGNVANLRREKAHDVLLRSFSQVVDRFPNARLVIVGADMGMGPDLAALARALGVEDRVRFLGRRDDATQLMPGFDVFALSSRFEGLPLAMLEAMMRAVPIVSTAVGGVADVVDDGATGMLVPQGDEARLAEALVGVLADRGLAGRLGRAGRAKAEAQYSVERMVADYERLYREVLDEQAPGGVSP